MKAISILKRTILQFECYYRSLSHAIHVYGNDLEILSSSNCLPSENEYLIHTLLLDLAENLPSKPEASTKNFTTRRSMLWAANPREP